MVVPDRTVFFPTGGGQSCDLGTVNGFPVIGVYEDGDGAICHVVEVPAGGTAAGAAAGGCEAGAVSPGDAACPFAPGDLLEMEIDWARRFDNMQRHCGEHIMSGVFHKLYRGTNRGFHMGDDYMTVDISFESEDSPSGMTEEMLHRVEYEVNRIIWQDLPVTGRTFPNKEAASGIPVRKPITIEGEVTIVTVGDDFDPADSVACCGTHPTTSGQVGMFKIYRCEPNKGMHRVFFEAGERAFRHYVEKDEILGVIEKDLSAGVPDLLKKYRARQEKQQEARERLYRLTGAVLDSEEARIAAVLADPDGERLFEYSILTLDDLIQLGRRLAPSVSRLLYLVHRPSNTVLLVSGSKQINCGKLVKDNAPVFGGKGGGSADFARAIFPREDDLKTFTDAVSKLTR
ncbi:MAG: hypothetical protein IKF70_01065 [Firmicutes bacterium]|nr:hypothetical protein [Bacillota bacterium]